MLGIELGTFVMPNTPSVTELHYSLWTVHLQQTWNHYKPYLSQHNSGWPHHLLYIWTWSGLILTHTTGPSRLVESTRSDNSSPRSQGKIFHINFHSWIFNGRHKGWNLGPSAWEKSLPLSYEPQSSTGCSPTKPWSGPTMVSASKHTGKPWLRAAGLFHFPAVQHSCQQSNGHGFSLSIPIMPSHS